MTVSRMRVLVSETRDMADRHRARRELRLGDPEAWQLGNGAFFVAFVAIAAALTVLALVLR